MQVKLECLPSACWVVACSEKCIGGSGADASANATHPSRNLYFLICKMA